MIHFIPQLHSDNTHSCPFSPLPNPPFLYPVLWEVQLWNIPESSGIKYFTGYSYWIFHIKKACYYVFNCGVKCSKAKACAGLRMGGTFIVLFFVTQEAGRVSQQDATTMRLVLEAAPEIGSNYGIIVNKVYGVKFEFGKFLTRSCV